MWLQNVFGVDGLASLKCFASIYRYGLGLVYLLFEIYETYCMNRVLKKYIRRPSTGSGYLLPCLQIILSSLLSIFLSSFLLFFRNSYPPGWGLPPPLPCLGEKKNEATGGFWRTSNIWFFPLTDASRNFTSQWVITLRSSFPSALRSGPKPTQISNNPKGKRNRYQGKQKCKNGLVSPGV